MLRTPLRERVDDEPLGWRATLAEDVDDVDARAGRECAHQRIHGVLTGLRGAIEARGGAIGPAGVEPVLAHPDGAHGDRRLRDGVWDDLWVRHATQGSG
jgi:hypothetical protein